MVKLNENTAYKRGQELLDSGQYEEAIAKFSEVIAENPRAWKAMNSQGFAFQKMSKYTDAVNCFDQALAINPKSVEVLNMRYGLNGQGERTLKEVGEKMNLSRERVRQIEKHAIAKIRANKICDISLKDYVA